MCWAYYFEAVAVAGMSGAGGQESTSGSSSRPPPPCIECLHELLASSKRLRGNAILPHEQVKVIVQHCAGVKERLEACKHRRQQQQQEQRFDERNSNPRHHDFPQQEDGSVELKHVLCPRHSGLINEALGMDLLRLCFRNLGAEDLCRCASVCKLWRKVVDMDELWNSLLHQLPCKNFVSLEDTNALRIPPKLRYVLYRNGSQWDERFCGSYIVDSGHPATTTASDEEQEAVAEFLEKRRTVVVSSSGSKLYQLIQHTTIDHTLPHENNVGRTRTRKRFVVKACPSLCKGAGRWTVHLKRLCSSAVNAVGLEAEWKRKAGKQEEEEKYQEKTMALAWLFNTDGSDFPLVETNMEGTAVEMHR